MTPSSSDQKSGIVETDADVLITHLNAHGQGQHEAVWRTWDEMVEAAMRAAYKDQPQLQKDADGVRRPISYEECYGCAPLENPEDAQEMRIALRAALTYSDEEIAAFKERSS